MTFLWIKFAIYSIESCYKRPSTICWFFLANNFFACWQNFRHLFLNLFNWTLLQMTSRKLMIFVGRLISLGVDRIPAIQSRRCAAVQLSSQSSARKYKSRLLLSEKCYVAGIIEKLGPSRKSWVFSKDSECFEVFISCQ